MSEGQVVPVGSMPGSIAVDDAGEEIGIHTEHGVVPFNGAPPAEGSPAPGEWAPDAHDPLGAFSPPSTPTEYELEVVDRDYAPELAAVAEAQTLFHEWGLDQATAGYLWRGVQRALAKPLTNAEIELGAARTRADLERRHGADGAKALIERAQSEIKRIAATKPEVSDWLNDTGLGNDWWLIERLALRAEVRAARNKSKGADRAAALSTSASMGVEQAQRQLDELQSHADFGKAYLDDPAFQARVHRLQETIAGG